MTKAELIAKLTDWSDDTTVCIVTPLIDGWLANDVARVYDHKPSCPADCNELYLEPTNGRVSPTRN